MRLNLQSEPHTIIHMNPFPEMLHPPLFFFKHTHLSVFRIYLLFSFLMREHSFSEKRLLIGYVFHHRVAMVIYASKPPLGACSIRACFISKLRKCVRCKLASSSVFYCSFSNSPSTKLLPKFHHCMSDVGILWILDCF